VPGGCDKIFCEGLCSLYTPLLGPPFVPPKSIVFDTLPFVALQRERCIPTFYYLKTRREFGETRELCKVTIQLLKSSGKVGKG
jgi:hypothetical protein